MRQKNYTTASFNPDITHSRKPAWQFGTNKLSGSQEMSLFQDSTFGWSYSHSWEVVQNPPILTLQLFAPLKKKKNTKVIKQRTADMSIEKKGLLKFLVMRELFYVKATEKKKNAG